MLLGGAPMPRLLLATRAIRINMTGNFHRGSTRTTCRPRTTRRTLAATVSDRSPPAIPKDARQLCVQFTGARSRNASSVGATTACFDSGGPLRRRLVLTRQPLHMCAPWPGACRPSKRSSAATDTADKRHDASRSSGQRAERSLTHTPLRCARIKRVVCGESGSNYPSFAHLTLTPHFIVIRSTPRHHRSRYLGVLYRRDEGLIRRLALRFAKRVIINSLK